MKLVSKGTGRAQDNCLQNYIFYMYKSRNSRKNVLIEELFILCIADPVWSSPLTQVYTLAAAAVAASVQ
jgi:hypothetical protein